MAVKCGRSDRSAWPCRQAGDFAELGVNGLVLLVRTPDGLFGVDLVAQDSLEPRAQGRYPTFPAATDGSATVAAIGDSQSEQPDFVARETSTVILRAPVTVVATPPEFVIVGLDVISQRRMNVAPSPAGAGTPQFAGVSTHPLLV